MKGACLSSLLVGSDEELTYLRDMTYRYTDVFLMCYSIDNPDSLSNIEIKWMPDVKRICPNGTAISLSLLTSM